MAKFEKGHPGHKPKGPNKKTKEILESIDWVLKTIEDDHLKDDIKSLKPNERVTLWTNLMEYRKPKLARTETELKVNNDVIDISLKID